MQRALWGPGFKKDPNEDPKHEFLRIQWEHGRTIPAKYPCHIPTIILVFPAWGLPTGVPVVFRPTRKWKQIQSPDPFFLRIRGTFSKVLVVRIMVC